MIKNTQLYDFDGHLSENLINQLKSRLLPFELKLEALEHIADCEQCAAFLAQCYAENECSPAPAELSANIISSIEQYEKTKQRSSFGYYLRLAAAVVITLFCFYSGVFSNSIKFLQTETQSKSINIPTPELGFSNDIVLNITKFTNSIIKMEGFNND